MGDPYATRGPVLRYNSPRLSVGDPWAIHGTPKSDPWKTYGGPMRGPWTGPEGVSWVAHGPALQTRGRLMSLYSLPRFGHSGEWLCPSARIKLAKQRFWCVELVQTPTPRRFYVAKPKKRRKKPPRDYCKIVSEIGNFRSRPSGPERAEIKDLKWSTPPWQASGDRGMAYPLASAKTNMGDPDGRLMRQPHGPADPMENQREAYGKPMGDPWERPMGNPWETRQPAL